MNCKPGDLAIRVRGNDCADRLKVGAIVRCLEFYPGLQWGHDAQGRYMERRDVWHVEHCGERISAVGMRFGVPDADLRPIRDPGDDARDEMLRPLPETAEA